MSLRTEIQTIIEALQSPMLPFDYWSIAESNLSLDNAVFPHVVCHPLWVGAGEVLQNNAIKEKINITLEFINTTALLEDDSETNDVIIQAMRLLAFKFIDAVNSGYILDKITTFQFEVIKENKYNVGCIGYSLSWEASLRKGEMFC